MGYVKSSCSRILLEEGIPGMLVVITLSHYGALCAIAASSASFMARLNLTLVYE